MPEDDVRKALEECAADAAADAERGVQPTAVEPEIPLMHSFETTVDPLAGRVSNRLRAWRGARRRPTK